jgi:hypothetical protein
LTCACAEPPFHYLNFERVALGMDPFHAEVSIDTCKRCGTPWLVYLIEQEHHTGSGRWWRVALSSEMGKGPTVAEARSIVEQASWCFVGGSFYNSTGHRVNAPIVAR